MFIKDSSETTNHEVAVAFFGCGDSVAGDPDAPGNGKRRPSRQSGRFIGPGEGSEVDELLLHAEEVSP